jgi:hypothetical protein
MVGLGRELDVVDYVRDNDLAPPPCWPPWPATGATSST